MDRTFETFPVKDIAIAKQQMLNWANQFNICCFMDNNDYPSPNHSFECLLGAGIIASYPNGSDFEKSLNEFYQNTPDWIFGHFNYELNWQPPANQPKLPDQIQFPDIFLYVPEIVVQLRSNEVSIGVKDNRHSEIFRQIVECDVIERQPVEPVQFSSRISKQDYISIIHRLLKHIKRGDCYEINFCQEFYADDIAINALQVYQLLSSFSPNPFSTYYRLSDKYLLCASPERYLKKTGTKLISQPIKGTSPRSFDNPLRDEKYRRDLYSSSKERSENVMIVDLVRNDLSRICERGSVQVDELFGVYSFPQVHQMISTISGTLKEKTTFSDILTATFPMGSMTGAPKQRVMELTDTYEKTKRGIYSGAVGYISPEKDFDFNVVIRSILYNSTNRYLSYQVGGGITGNSIAEKEYEECLLKAEAMVKIFDNSLQKKR